MSTYLSQNERSRSLKLYNAHIFLNGIGYSFQTEAIICLMALLLGANNTEIGIISSLIHITGLAMLLVPTIFSGSRIIKVYWTVWMVRGAACLTYGYCWYLNTQGHSKAALIILIISYAIYAVLRNLAWPMKQSLEGIIVKPREAGKHISTFSMYLSASRITAGIVCFLLLYFKVFNGFEGLVQIVFIGIVFNTISALIIKKIPVTETVEKTTDSGIIKVIKETMADSEKRKVVILFWCGIATTVMLAFIVPYFKKLSGMSDAVVFIYSACIGVAALSGGKFVRFFADNLGSRPLLAGILTCMAMLSGIWIFMPPDTSHPLLIFIAVLCFFTQTSMLLLINRLTIRAMPKDQKVGFCAMLNCFAAAMALVTGLACGAIADSGISLELGLTHTYSLNFLLLGVIAIFMCLLSISIKDTGSLSFSEAGNILFSPYNLRAFYYVDSLNKNHRDIERDIIMLKIVHSTSSIATEEIRRRLKSPITDKKMDTLTSLYFHPRPELVDEIIEEAQDRDSWWRETAIFTLGAYPDQKSRDTLGNIFRNESYPYLRSIAAKSLGRLKETWALDEIRELVKEERFNARTIINFIIALSRMDTDGVYMETIFNLARTRESRKFRQHIYIICAARLGYESEMEQAFHHENINHGDGFSEVLDSAARHDFFREKAWELLENYKAEEYDNILALCRMAVDNTIPENIRKKNLKKGLSFTGFSPTPSDAIAALFFSAMLLD